MFLAFPGFVVRRSLLAPVLHPLHLAVLINDRHFLVGEVIPEVILAAQEVGQRPLLPDPPRSRR